MKKFVSHDDHRLMVLLIVSSLSKDLLVGAYKLRSR